MLGKKTCADVDKEQTFKSNMMTLAFDDSEDHIVSMRLMNLVGKEMLNLKVAETLKKLQSKKIILEGVK